MRQLGLPQLGNGATVGNGQRATARQLRKSAKWSRVVGVRFHKSYLNTLNYPPPFSILFFKD